MDVVTRTMLFLLCMCITLTRLSKGEGFSIKIYFTANIHSSKKIIFQFYGRPHVIGPIPLLTLFLRIAPDPAPVSIGLKSQKYKSHQFGSMTQLQFQRTQAETLPTLFCQVNAYSQLHHLTVQN